MEHKTILITGGLGYIGTHLSKALIEKGYRVVIVDNKSNNYVDDIPEAEIYTFDMRDTNYLKSIFDYHKIDYVIHLAALKSVKESEEKPALYYSHNLGCLTSLMDASNCKNIIFASSASVYGNVRHTKCGVKDELDPVSIYGKTKAIGELLLEDLYLHDSSYKITILRYFNPIGYQYPGIQKGKNLVDLICQTIRGERDSFTKYNNGEDVRDYIYIGDLVNFTIENLESKGYSVFNVGSGVGYSTNDIISAFNRQFTVVDGGKREIDVPYLVAEAGVPTTKTLQEIIEEALQNK